MEENKITPNLIDESKGEQSDSLEQNQSDDIIIQSETPIIQNFESLLTQADESGAVSSVSPSSTEFADIYIDANVPKKDKKKRFMFLFSAILVLLILTAGTLTAYAFKDNLSNTFAKMTKSPAEYYSYVEKKSIAQSINHYSTYTKAYTQDSGYKMQSDVSFDKDSINSLLKSSINMGLDDIETAYGFKFDTIGFKMQYGKNKDIMNQTLGLRVNNVDLITLDLFLDLAQNKYLANIPELSKSYIDFSNEEIDASKDVKLPTEHETYRFLNRYLNLLLDHISQVDQKDNYEYKIDSLTKKCTKLTVTITDDDVKLMLKSILDEAKDDEYIIKLLPLYNVTLSDYQASISDAKSELENSTEKILDEDLKMIVYVDQFGKIIGRNLSSKDSEVSFGYGLLRDKNYEEYEFYVDSKDNNSILQLTGNHKINKKVYNGKAILKFEDPTKTNHENITIDLKYEDVNFETKDNQRFQTGTFRLTSLDLMGLQITSEFSVKDGVQANKTTLELGTSKLATIDSTLEAVKDMKPTMPEKDAKVVKSTDLDSYIATIDVEAYLDQLSDKLGFDVRSIANSLMYQYSMRAPSDEYYEDSLNGDDTDGFYEDIDLDDLELEDVDLNN